MRIVTITLSLLCAPTGYLPSYGVDPITEFRAFMHEGATKTLYYWKLNVNGNGKPVVFLTTQEDYKTDRHDGAVPSWRVYLPTADGRGYVPGRGIDFGDYVSEFNDIGVDPEKVYAGRITQLGKRGIVTIQVDEGRKRDPSVAYIHAYTIEGDHFKHVILATYNPDSVKDNPIHKQYLSSKRRMKVQLREIAP
jgi:hypothetical protein